MSLAHVCPTACVRVQKGPSPRGLILRWKEGGGEQTTFSTFPPIGPPKGEGGKVDSGSPNREKGKKVFFLSFFPAIQEGPEETKLRP